MTKLSPLQLCIHQHQNACWYTFADRMWLRRPRRRRWHVLPGTLVVVKFGGLLSF